MYSSSSGLLGSLVMPLRLSVLIWYWSMIQSRALRLMEPPSNADRFAFARAQLTGAQKNSSLWSVDNEVRYCALYGSCI
jgi:hypothetical protein